MIRHQFRLDPHADTSDPAFLLQTESRAIGRLDLILECDTFNFDQCDFVTSDSHFGHARIIELAGRPFESTEEMDEELILRWNQTVGRQDVVLHLGDLALGSILKSIRLTGKLNGRRLLVPGNHDRVSPSTQCEAAISRFTPIYEEAGWTILPEVVMGSRRGHPLQASHYPFEGDSGPIDRFRLSRPTRREVPLVHGHTHDRGSDHSLNQFHVGVEAHDFAPVRFALVDDWLNRRPR
ncbi:MAG: metallophosphoesterase [Microcella sp.]